jgi:hypothetical protein
MEINIKRADNKYLFFIKKERRNIPNEKETTYYNLVFRVIITLFISCVSLGWLNYNYEI